MDTAYADVAIKRFVHYLGFLRVTEELGIFSPSPKVEENKLFFPRRSMY